MNKLDLSNRSQIEKEIAGALKCAMDSHGPITLTNRNSAAKRIYCALKALCRRDDILARIGSVALSDFEKLVDESIPSSTDDKRWWAYDDWTDWLMGR